MRFKHRFFVRQRDAMLCGVSCLSMICKYYGKNISMDLLTNLCKVTHSGISMLGLHQAALKLGFSTVAGKIDILQLSIFLPCILHWNQNHFVVLYKIKANNFYIADPAKGLVRYSREEFQQHWIGNQTDDQLVGIAMFLKPTNDSYKHDFGSNDEPRSFCFLFRYLKEYKNYFFQIFIGLFLGCILQLILPFLTQGIVDIGIKQHNIGLIWLILIGELLIVIGRTATDFIRRWLLLHISMRINISLVSDFFIKLLKLPMGFFDTKLMGDLLQRMGDHSRVQSFLTNQVLGIVFTILSFGVFGVVLFIYSKLIFAVFLAGSMLYTLWIAYFLKERRVLDYELFEQQAISQNKTYQFITSMQEIKLQGCEQRRRWEWEDTQADLFKLQMKSLKLQQTQEAGSIFINEVKNVFITVLAATAVIHGQITLGAMLAIQYIVGQLNSPVEQFMNFIYSLQDVKISMERINEIHQSKNEEDADRHLTTFEKEKTIQFSNVSFKYDCHALKDTLANINLFIPSGKFTAIVGASGSGKTTLIKLMLGYYPVSSGDIFIAGQNLKAYNLKWWRNHCGVVMQDGVIFSESIARNIAIDDRDVDVGKLEEAARIACINEYVESLPLKYDTKIGPDGIGLSQGQRQRILIARAVYKNPDFIFLDEATNALDAQNERKIVENLQSFYRGRTVVVVAHRLSTVKDADQIVVVDKGRLAEQGNHIELTAKKGVYYNLVKNQLELGN